MRRIVGLVSFFRGAVGLVWQTNRRLALLLLLLSPVSGVLPALMAYLGKGLLDRVGGNAARDLGLTVQLLRDVGYLLGVATCLLIASRVLALADALLRVQLAQRVTEQVLQKALTFTVQELDDPELQDRLARVQQHAAERPLSLVRKSLAALQQGATVLSFALLLGSFAWWLPLVLLLAAVPALWAEVRYNADAFELFRFRSPEARKQAYLETLLTRSDYSKEITLFGLGPLLLGRHQRIFQELYRRDRRLSLRRGVVGLILAGLGAATLAASYALIAVRGAQGELSVGAVAMLFVALRQMQASAFDGALLVAGMHEDYLYLVDLRALLERVPTSANGTQQSGPRPGDGLRFERVSFSYPDAREPALQDVTLHVPAGQTLGLTGKNGAGKTTLIKLALGLYTPTTGRVTWDGLELEQWDRAALQTRMTAIFQDFVQYQLLAGENIGVGRVTHVEDQDAWQHAAHDSSANVAIERLPKRYLTQLGRWFEQGQELSLGEWQRVALARLFIHQTAELFVLDEPTASLDPAAEELLVERLRQRLAGKVALVASHRPAALRLAHQVIELERGRVVRTTTPQPA